MSAKIKEIIPAASTVKTDDSLSGLDLGMRPFSSIQKNAKRRRFSAEQIKFLEFVYDSESRPESQIKQQLASELGLQPHQVAIWFQNRRARLKTKQIEIEYNLLKASYDALASSFESLKQQNESLLIQLQSLRNLLAKHHGSSCELGETESKFYGRIESTTGTPSESKDTPNLLLEACGHNANMPAASDHNNRHFVGTMEETAVTNLTEDTKSSMSSYDLHVLGSKCFLDKSSCSSQWWEFCLD